MVKEIGTAVASGRGAKQGMAVMWGHTAAPWRDGGVLCHEKGLGYVGGNICQT